MVFPPVKLLENQRKPPFWGEAVTVNPMVSRPLFDGRSEERRVGKGRSCRRGATRWRRRVGPEGRPCTFVQAGDGIRDRIVTGVQTCALPIYLLNLVNSQVPASERLLDGLSAGEVAREPEEASLLGRSGNGEPDGVEAAIRR